MGFSALSSRLGRWDTAYPKEHQRDGLPLMSFKLLAAQERKGKARGLQRKLRNL